MAVCFLSASFPGTGRELWPGRACGSSQQARAVFRGVSGELWCASTSAATQGLSSLSGILFSRLFLVQSSLCSFLAERAGAGALRPCRPSATLGCAPGRRVSAACREWCSCWGRAAPSRCRRISGRPGPGERRALLFSVQCH